jgi:hypothetical protein
MATTVIISDEGGRNPRRIKTNGCDRSWSIESSGTLSCEVLTADLVKHGLMRPKSKWVFVEDNDAGSWAGVISDSNAKADGTTEIAAIDWKGSLFDKRSLPKQSRPHYGPAGALALMAIRASEQELHLWAEDRTAEETGDPVQLQFDGQDLLDGLESLRSASGQEYDIDPDTMAFHWGPMGRDKTNTVQLVAPRHIVDFTVPDSLDPVVNWLKATASGNSAIRAQSITAVNLESMADVGIRMGRETLDGALAASALKRVAQSRVDQLAAQGATLECRIVNRDADDRCFGWFRHGDTICALIPQISSQLDIRIMARSLSDDDQVMSVSAIITNWTVW